MRTSKFYCINIIIIIILILCPSVTTISLNQNSITDTKYIQSPVTHDEAVQKLENTKTAQTRGTSRVNNDVGIENIVDIDKTIFNLDHYPGNVVHLSVTVKNFGENDINKPFQIVMTISDSATIQPYYFIENKTLPACLGISVLKANTSYNLTWNWTAPTPEERAGSENNFLDKDVTFTVFFTTMLVDDLNAGNNQKWIEIEVQKPDFIIELQTQEKEKLITIQPGKLNIFPFNFTLFNHGKGTFINYSTEAPADWKVIPPLRKFYNDRTNSSQENLSIIVYPSINRRYLPTATPLKVSLTAIAENYPLAKATIEFTVKVSFMPYPKVVPPELEQGEKFTVSPGVAYIDFKVYNMGNGEDNFETEAQLGRFDYETSSYEAMGWNVDVHSGKYTRILKRGAYQIVTIKVIVPATVPRESTCIIKVSATSVKDPEHLDAEKNVTFLVFVDLNKDVAFVESELKPMYILPNSERSTIFKIRNTGNYYDETISVNVTSQPDDWEVLLDLSDLPYQGLPRNNIADIQISVKTPKQVIESIYYIGLAAISNKEIKDEMILPVHVLKERRIALKCNQAKKTGNVSEKISYIITVENNGNSKDSINLKQSFQTPGMDEENWKIELSKNVTTLYPYESRDVILSVVIPLGALADTVPYTSFIQDGYRIKVSGISQNDTSITDDKELEILVNPVYDFEFNKNKDKKYIIQHQTQIVDYSFKVTNKGNTWDMIKIDHDMGQTWISIPSAHHRLLPGITEEIIINFDPPSHLPPGEYKFNITGTSENIPNLTANLELTLEIIDSDLEITNIQIGDGRSEVREGETVLIRVLITNIGDLDYYSGTFIENIVIKFMEGSNYIGELNISYLASRRKSDNNFIWISHPWKIGKARTYTLIIKLDPYDAFPESSDNNNELSFKLEVTGEDTVKEDGDKEERLPINIQIMLISIIVTIIVMCLGIWANITISKRGTKKGYTKDGEYKPYQETDKAVFEKEEEEEPEVGILGMYDEHPYRGRTSKGFMKDILSIIPMKPIRKTKPIKKSKPINGLTKEANRIRLEKSQIAGYLPPKMN